MKERRTRPLVLPLAALAAFGTALSAAPTRAAHEGAVVFTVDHVRNSEGHVRVDVCTRDTFLKAECPYSGAAPAVEGVTTVVVEDVPPGQYAAQIYHDRNDNHKVDMRLHIPVEEVGFSNNAAVGLHGPKFDAAAFDHDAGDTPLAVRLRHFV
jgi:uncharacterized protein (DUF2141 family)